MRNIKLTIEYDGTNYAGWQRQSEDPTVQETIESALSGMTGEKIVLYGSGRTDSGVHALGQVANFKTKSAIKTGEFQKGLNSILPKDIVIINSEEAEDGFHAQFSSKSKVYVYKVLNRPHGTAIMRKRVWHIPYKLSLTRMSEAAAELQGEHDFNAFCQASPDVKSTVRNVLSAEFKKTEGDILEFTIEADGFLKRMVRLIAGTLVQAGKERITPGEFLKILESGEKTKFVQAAPAWGLYLREVKY